MANWAGIPTYKAALDAAMGSDALARLEEDVSKELGAFNKMAEQVYANWMRLV